MAAARHFSVVGDTTWCKCKITGKRDEDGQKLVDMDVWGENQRGETGIKATATVRLPSKVPANLPF